jgi:hypothetical protein
MLLVRWSWSPYSPDMNPCAYFLWGFLKDSVYRNNSHTLKNLTVKSQLLFRASLRNHWLLLWKTSINTSKWYWICRYHILDMFLLE